MNEIRIQNNIGELGSVFTFIEKMLASHGIHDDLLKNNLCLCADEVVANSIRYAYADAEPHQITVRMELFDQPKKIILYVEDDGLAFNPLETNKPDITLPIEEREIGGLGLFIVSNLMNNIEYQRIGTKNVLSMTKNLE